MLSCTQEVLDRLGPDPAHALRQLEACSNIVGLEIRVVRQDGLGFLTLRQQTEHGLDGDPKPMEDRLPAEDLGVRRDPLQEVALCSTPSSLKAGSSPRTLSRAS